LSRLRLLRDERGVSLVELVIVLAIMGIVLASLTTVFVRGNKVQTDLNARFQAQTSARVALTRLGRDARCGKTVTGTSASVTLTLPTVCGGGTVSWCALGSGTRYSLYRQVGASCTASGVRWADYLTTSSVFTVYPPTTASLAKLGVNLAVSRRTQSALDGYALQDEVVLRNSVRS
jgi:prepilin-type N-terminal cleavage/methylation domain-containing protein